MALRWVAAGYFSCMKESGPISVVFAEEVLAKRAEVFHSQLSHSRTYPVLRLTTPGAVGRALSITETDDFQCRHEKGSDEISRCLNARLPIGLVEF